MIFGERIRLRGVEREDLPYFYQWLNDPEVRFGLSLYLPLSNEEEIQWYASLAELQPAERVLSIEIKENGAWTLIGSCGFRNIEWNNRSAEFGIVIGRKNLWNQGYGSETVRVMLRHAFETLNLNRVYLRVNEKNLRAIHAYTKTGFILEGRMRQAVYKNGGYEDMLLMSVLRPEWNKE